MVAVLHLCHCAVVWHDDHHAVAIGIVHRASLLEIGDFLPAFAITGDTEKAHRTTIFEIVFDIVVLCAVDFHHELVERVVIGASATDGIPCIAAFHLAHQTHRFGLSAICLALRVVFYLKQ